MLGTIIHPPFPQYFTAQVPLRSSAFLRHNCVLCVANAYPRCVCIIALHLRVYIAVVFLQFAFTLRVVSAIKSSIPAFPIPQANQHCVPSLFTTFVYHL